MSIITGIELSLVLKVGANPKALYVHYSSIDTGFSNGQVHSPERLVPLVFPQSEGWDLISRVLEWIEEVKSAVHITDAISLADFPVDFNSNLLVGPDGIDYSMTMGNLDIDMAWDKGSDTVTISAGPEFTVSFEAFLYYVDTLVDLTNAILIQKA